MAWSIGHSLMRFRDSGATSDLLLEGAIRVTKKSSSDLITFSDNIKDECEERYTGEVKKLARRRHHSVLQIN